MSIATSIEKLSETLTNCKANLKEKGVEAETIKISDVDEKILEIKSGGGGIELPFKIVKATVTTNSNTYDCTGEIGSAKTVYIDWSEDIKSFSVEFNTNVNAGRLYFFNTQTSSRIFRPTISYGERTEHEFKISNESAQYNPTFDLLFKSPETGYCCVFSLYIEATGDF